MCIIFTTTSRITTIESRSVPPPQKKTHEWHEEQESAAIIAKSSVVVALPRTLLTRARALRATDGTDIVKYRFTLIYTHAHESGGDRAQSEPAASAAANHVG